jgi:oligopeptide/dipeptide ABC transporter ATP-binding protein
MSEGSHLIEVNELCKYFPVSGHRLLKAVDGVNFKIRKGEVLGLVGESGCGKTTIGRVILNLLSPTSGVVSFGGVNLQELTKSEMRRMRRMMQIVFQDPYASLNPRMTIGSILTFPMKVQGVHKGKREKRAIYLLERVGMRASDLNRYPHEFSGGQLQRVGIARALAVDPEFIVADEPVSALDVSVQSQVLNLLKELQEEFHLTSLFIAHDLSVVEFISDRIAVLYLGKIVEMAPSQVLYTSSRHPYTRSLLSAIPLPDPEIEKNKPPFSLTGETTSPIDPPPGCRFFSRCPAKREICEKKDPVLVEVAEDHYLACFAEGSE